MSPTSGQPAKLRAIDWIVIPGGTFLMGGSERDEESPAHEVAVDSFRLARFQVTRADYQAFLDESLHEAPPFWDEPQFQGPMRPAVGPSWDDAQLYCAWLTPLAEQPGQNRSTTLEVQPRLPTEAEWEYAAKAGRNVRYPWGDQPPESLPNYADRWLEGPEEVDAYPSLHPLGLVGMGENVHEWCQDWFDADYYAASPKHNPQGPETGRRRASRGGSWRHAIKVSRCAARSSIPPSFRYSDYGFRLAADLPG